MVSGIQPSSLKLADFSTAEVQIHPKSSRTGIERAGTEGTYTPEFVANSRVKEWTVNAKASATCGGLARDLKVLSLLYLAALEARSADAYPTMGPLYDRAYRAQIHVPAPLGDVMSVADVVSKLRPFAAHFAYACHDTNSRI